MLNLVIVLLNSDSRCIDVLWHRFALLLQTLKLFFILIYRIQNIWNFKFLLLQSFKMLSDSLEAMPNILIDMIDFFFPFVDLIDLNLIFAPKMDILGVNLVNLLIDLRNRVNQRFHLHIRLKVAFAHFLYLMFVHLQRLVVFLDGHFLLFQDWLKVCTLVLQRVLVLLSLLLYEVASFDYPFQVFGIAHKRLDLSFVTVDH